MEELLFLLLGLLAVGIVIATPLIAVYLWQRVKALEERTEVLEQRLRSLQKEKTAASTQSSKAASSAAKAASTAKRDTAPPVPQKLAPTPPAPPPLPVFSSSADPADQPAESPSAPTSTPETPSASRDFESLLGQTWLVRIGVLVLLIGVAFFLKYAFDQAWIGPEVRVSMGGVGGLVLWALGARFHRKQLTPLANAFSGGGSALLYLSLFASYAFYGFLDPLLAFALMVVVTLATVLLALRQDALPLAGLALLGGYLTPILVGEEDTSAHFFCAYVLALDLGMLIPLRLRAWRSLLPMMWAGSHVLILVWLFLTGFSTAPYEVAAWSAALVLFFLAAAVVVRALPRKQAPELEAVLLVLTAAIWPAIGTVLLWGRDRDFLAVLHAVLALAFGIAFWHFSKTGRRAYSLDRVAWFASHGLATLATLAALEGAYLTLSWALLAGLSLLFASRRLNPGFQVSGLLLIAAAIARVFLVHGRYSAFLEFSTSYTDLRAAAAEAFLNLDFLASIAVAVCLAGLWRFLRSKHDWLPVVALSLLIAAVAREIDLALLHEVADAKIALRNTRWTWAYASLFAGFSFAAILRRKSNPLVETAITLWIVFGAIWLVYLLTELQAREEWFLFNLPFASILLLPLGWFAIEGWSGRRMSSRELGWLRRVGASALLVGLISVEAYRYFERTADPQPSARAGSVALSVTWAISAVSLLIVGILSRHLIWRLCSLGLFAATLAKVLLFDLAALDAIYRIISFLVVGALCMGAAWLYNRYGERIFGSSLQNDLKPPHA